MNLLRLKRVTDKYFDDIVKLSDTLTEYQKTCVAPNMRSLAQAYVNKKRAWPRAVFLGNKPIGFVMLALWDEDIPKEDLPAYYLWRFMIANPYQQKGYGTRALDLIKEKCKNEHIRYLYTSCEMHGEQPYQFYMKYGFVDTGRNDGEQILKLKIEV
ncbi:MAG: GNAT family N-acetyltransferase [Bacilli bacterium]|nr:GNAT family N-acetyltransferase [Bacilli bacterium]